MTESSIALRKASASARSRSARRRRRVSRASSTSTDTSAIEIAVTSAVSMFGNRSGAARQPSTRSMSEAPGRSMRCCEVNTRVPMRREVPSATSRVPSASVKATSWPRVSVGPTSSTSVSRSE
ncbi:hypothetical protein D9M69_544540 [compost metagenome]